MKDWKESHTAYKLLEAKRVNQSKILLKSVSRSHFGQSKWDLGGLEEFVLLFEIWYNILPRLGSKCKDNSVVKLTIIAD